MIIIINKANCGVEFGVTAYLFHLKFGFNLAVIIHLT